MPTANLVRVLLFFFFPYALLLLEADHDPERGCAAEIAIGRGWRKSAQLVELAILLSRQGLA